MVQPINLANADVKDQLNVNVIGLVQQLIEPHKKMQLLQLDILQMFVLILLPPLLLLHHHHYLLNLQYLMEAFLQKPRQLYQLQVT